MATKRKAASAGAKQRKLAATVRKSAREIWYAGLGVFATTRQEGGKIFDALVKEGRRAEAGARKLATSEMTRLRARLTKVKATATRRARTTLKKVRRKLAKRARPAKARISRQRTTVRRANPRRRTGR
ncbi:MAG: phasin family protein [Burkholderiales bacterium]